MRLCHNSMGKKEYDREVQRRPVDETDTKEDELKLNCPSPQCKLQFDKDHRLLFHVRIEHRDGDPEENNLLWEKAKNVITLNKRSAASLECAVCNYVLDSRGSFWSHVTKRHGIPWEQYLEQHGMPERKMWQCRICGFQTEHDRAKLSHHLKTSHSLSWQEYQKQVHNIKEEDIPAPLPEMKHNLEEYNQRRKHSSVGEN